MKVLGVFLWALIKNPYSLSFFVGKYSTSAKPSDNPELPLESESIKNFHLTPGYFSVDDHS